MKSFTLLSWTAVLSLFLVCSCRTNDEFSVLTASAEPVAQTPAPFDGEIKDPPKDVPKDYDNWRPE